MRLASRRVRLAAHLTDGALGVAIMSTPALAHWLSGRDMENSTGYFFWGMAAALCFLCYQAWILTTGGQTVGKRAFKIRIVDYHDGSNPGFVNVVLIRWLGAAVLAGAVPFFGPVDICFIFGDERRCLHDLMAGTTVVRVADTKKAPR